MANRLYCLGYPVQVQTADWPSPSMYGRHDIAMLILKRPVTFTKTVQPICLPPPTNFESYARCEASSGEYRQCGINPLRALGWGEFGPESDDDDDDGQHPTLKQLDPPAVYVDEVSRGENSNKIHVDDVYDYPYEPYDPYPFIYTSVQIISGQIHNICKGDSGGPLMYQDQESKKWTIIGTSSGSRGCSSTGMGNFGNFSSWVPVSAHDDWIQKHLSGDGTTKFTCAGSPAGTDKTGW